MRSFPGPLVTREPTAAGPLDGRTFAVKDLIDIAGHVTGGGNPDWLRTHGLAALSAPIVEQLLAAARRYAAKRSPMSSPSASRASTHIMEHR